MDLKRKNNEYRIVAFNCNGIGCRIIELRQLVKNLKIDILLLSEIRTDGKRKIKIPGNKYLSKNRTDRNGGGVTILVKRNIRVHQHKLPDRIKSDAIAIKLNESNTVIVSLYSYPGNKELPQDITKIERTTNKIIIAGDFNAKHATWNCSTNNFCGNALYNLINKINMEVLFPDSLTLFPSNGGPPSTVDIVIYKNISRIQEPQVISDLNSDHYPIFFALNFLHERKAPKTV